MTLQIAPFLSNHDNLLSLSIQDHLQFAGINTVSTMGVWMFGYGSLIWKIDFPVIRRVTGYVSGYTRTMEWADEVHRGVPGHTSRTAAIFR